MANVINEARWDENVRQWSATGGPSYSTQIVSVQSGDEQRSANWIQPRGTYNLGDRDVPSAKYQKLLSFFHRMRGRFQGFRVRDWTDYADDGRGVLGNGQGNGSMSYQMNKIRAVDGVAGATYQKITRPVGPTFAANPDLGNSVKVYRNGVEVPQVNAPDGCLVDDSKGTVLFIPGDSGLPSFSDSLTWTGMYDIPARFDVDSFNMNQIQAFIESGEEQRPSDVWIRLGSIPVIQLRE